MQREAYWVHITRSLQDGLLFFDRGQAEQELARIRRESPKGDRWQITPETRPADDWPEYDTNEQPR